MKSAVRVFGFAAVVFSLLMAGRAQERSSSAPDPRVGLKPGLKDAGEAARNMKRIATLSKPEGFFDPKQPGGAPTPPERDPNLPSRPTGRAAGSAVREHAELRELRPRVQRQPPVHGELPRLQHLRHRAAGQAEAAGLGGVPGRPGRRVGARQPADHVGGADARPRRLRHQGVGERRSSAERFRGVRIFDITDVSKPKQVAAVQTCRGSHTHTLVTDPERQGQPLRLRLGHRLGAVGRGARRLLRRQAGGGSRTPRSSAST